jgi:hypothetical protein
MAAMKAKKWNELAVEQRGYVLNTLGKSIAQIATNLIGFTDF